MPLGNAFAAPQPAKPWMAAQKPGMFKNPFGSSAIGARKPMAQGFGVNPITGAPVASQAEANQLLDPQSPQGKGLMQQIYSPQGQEIAELRRKLLQNREM